MEGGVSFDCAWIWGIKNSVLISIAVVIVSVFFIGFFLCYFVSLLLLWSFFLSSCFCLFSLLFLFFFCGVCYECFC